jgi:hypothetical protein
VPVLRTGDLRFQRWITPRETSNRNALNILAPQTMPKIAKPWIAKHLPVDAELLSTQCVSGARRECPRRRISL